MRLDMKFEESNQRIDLTFEEVQQASDGGFERGYEQGYTEGNENGYKNGYFEGQEQSASLFGIINEVKGTNIVTCDYVNENEHSVEVKLSSDTVTDFSGCEVVVTSSNIFDISKFVSGNFVTNNGDGSITLKNYIEANNKISDVLPTLKVGDTIIFSHRIFFGGDQRNPSVPLVVTQDMLNNNLIGFYAYNNTSAENPMIIEDIMFCYGSVLLPYEPYTEKTYTANADGTVDGVTSISPVMNIICEGVDITAKYYCMQDVEWHRFWDIYQQYGTRTNYTYGFGGLGWTDETFNPKYPLTIGVAYMMFREAKITDLTTKDYVFDFSQASSCDYVFLSVLVKQLNIIGVEGTRLDTMFQDMRALETLNYTGTIGKTSVRLQWSSNLNVECAKNIIRSLINYKGTNYDMSYQISFHANVWTLLDAEGNTSPNGNTWKDYISDIGWSYS